MFLQDALEIITDVVERRLYTCYPHLYCDLDSYIPIGAACPSAVLNFSILQFLKNMCCDNTNNDIYIC